MLAARKKYFSFKKDKVKLRSKTGFLKQNRKSVHKYGYRFCGRQLLCAPLFRHGRFCWTVTADPLLLSKRRRTGIESRCVFSPRSSRRACTLISTLQTLFETWLPSVLARAGSPVLHARPVLALAAGFRVEGAGLRVYSSCQAGCEVQRNGCSRNG